MPNFWEKLSKPFFCLAPMEGVTDFAFREMFARYSGQEPRSKNQNPKGNSFVMYTEFVNVDGLTHPEGFERLKIDLKYSEAQRPIVAQIWGRNPQKFYEAAGIIAKLGFDGVDINFGCPQDKEISQKTCAALILEPKLAGEIISATKNGAQGLPVSVKTRLGYGKIETEEWVGFLLKQGLAAIAIHARTKAEKSKVPAHWEEIKKAVEIRNKLQVTSDKKTLIIGNGDIASLQEGLKRIRETGCDGVMVGRGAFGNPFFFRTNHHQPSTKERLSAMLEHARFFEKEFYGAKSFVLMRKHFKAYASGFEGAHELRAKLMETKSLEETEKIAGKFIESLR